MYLRLSAGMAVREKEILGIFDLDNTTSSHLTRGFLERAEREGRLESLTSDIPKAFVLCGDRKRSRIYFAQPSPATLFRRAESGTFE